jgi:hypothetical protein
VKTLKTETVKGYFLSFDDDELENVRKELERRDYAPDASGMQEFLMDALFAPEKAEEKGPTTTENIISMGQEFIKNNPEVVRMGMSAAQKIIKNFRHS